MVFFKIKHGAVSEWFWSLQRVSILLFSSLFNFSSFYVFLTTNVNSSPTHITLCDSFPSAPPRMHVCLFVCYSHWTNWSGCAHAAVRPPRRVSARPNTHGRTHWQWNLRELSSTLTMTALKCQKLIYKMAKKGFCLIILYQKYVILSYFLPFDHSKQTCTYCNIKRGCLNVLLAIQRIL